MSQEVANVMHGGGDDLDVSIAGSNPMKRSGSGEHEQRGGSDPQAHIPTRTETDVSSTVSFGRQQSGENASQRGDSDAPHDVASETVRVLSKSLGLLVPAGTVVMRRKFVRNPMLAIDWPDSHGLSHHRHHRHEQWSELFYDLVLVVTCLQLGTLLAHNTSTNAGLKIYAIFSVLRTVWADLVTYQNRFHTDDMLHTLYYGLHAACAFAMALHLKEVQTRGAAHHRRLADDHATNDNHDDHHADDHADDHHADDYHADDHHADDHAVEVHDGLTWDASANMRGFAIPAALALVASMAMVFYVSFRLPEQHYAQYIRREGRSRGFNALLMLISLAFSESEWLYFWLLLAGHWRLAFEFYEHCTTPIIATWLLLHQEKWPLLTKTMMPVTFGRQNRPPKHTEHLVARAGAFVMISLGEGMAPKRSWSESMVIVCLC
jgi:hypothetical protein